MLRVGVQTGGGWYNREDPDSSFAFIKSCGFDDIDFNIDHYLSPATLAKSEDAPTSFFDQSVEEILEYFTPVKNAAEKNGLRFSQMHAPFPIWIKDREDINDHIIMAIEKCLAVCAFVGCPAIVVHPIGRTDKNDEIETNLMLYRKLMPAAKKYKVVICLENLFKTVNAITYEGPCADAKEAVWYIDKLNEEAGEKVFGFCFDIGHALLTKKNVKQYLLTLGKRLTVLHLHDNNSIFDCHMAPYSYIGNGKGFICDWEGFIEALREIGYRDTLSFETFRVNHVLPKELWKPALTYISTIGRYWSDRIEAPADAE